MEGKGKKYNNCPDRMIELVSRSWIIYIHDFINILSVNVFKVII